MGRTYFVEETVGQYLSNLSTEVQPYVTGLLIGQDYVIQAVRTPPKEEQKEDINRLKLAAIDEEWITTHASQVSRMLPGGLLVLGVFIITSPELSKDSQNALRKLIFSVEKSLTKRRLWKPAEEEVSERAALQICLATRNYDLSLEVEAAADTSTTSPKSRKSMVKRFSLLFLGSEMIAHSTPIKDQPKSTPGGSSGESTDSASVSSCDFNHSEAEDVCIGPIDTPDTPHESQKKLSESSTSSSISYSMDASPLGVASVISDPAVLFSSDKCSNSVTSTTSEELSPVYNQQNKDMCIIRISTEDNNGNMYKSILLTNQDKTPAVLQRALLKHNLESDAAEDYELVQVISEDKELVIPDNANVFYAMNSHVNFDFILRKKASVNMDLKMRSHCNLTLPRTARRGCWSNRLSKITL